MTRRQLPPQIKKIEVLDRTSGKTVVRYQLTIDSGVNAQTGRRQQVRRRFIAEREARSPREHYFEGMAQLGDMTDEERREWFVANDNFFVE
jgi:hypothetical protein